MKKYLKFAVMAAFALVTAYNVHKVQTEVVLSDAQLKNVEALSDQEFLGSYIQLTNQGWLCFDDIRDDMSEGFFLCTDCKGCINTTATYAGMSGYCER